MHIDTVCRETCFRQSSLLSMYGSAMDHMLARAEFPYGACCGPMCVGGYICCGTVPLCCYTLCIAIVLELYEGLTPRCAGIC